MNDNDTTKEHTILNIETTNELVQETINMNHENNDITIEEATKRTN